MKVSVRAGVLVACAVGVLALPKELPCGSHTLTVAGVSANRLIVYSNNSSSSG